MRPMRHLLPSIVLGIAVLGAVASCSRPSHEAPAPAARRGPRPLRDVTYQRTAARLERGRYLTEGVLQCFNCHSDRDLTKPGAPPLAGRKGAGHVWEDRPWLVSPNLTPDRETGAGTWTDDMFERAIREGIGHDGRVLHPQMWYGSFRSLSDEDLASVIVYLRSLDPVRNPLPVTKLPAGREPLVAPEPLDGPVAAPDQSTAIARGAYLVRVADCQGCHTAWEAPLNPGFFGGGNQIEMFGRPAVFSANLTSAPSGIGSYYDEALFREVLHAGALKGRTLSPVMPWNVFRNMTDSDLDAVFAYLKSRRPVNHAVSNTDEPTKCPICGQVHGLGDRNKLKVMDSVATDPRALRDCPGRFRFDDGYTAEISSDGKNLRVQFDGAGPIVTLVQLSTGEFTAPEIPDYFLFRRDASGRVIALVTNVDEVGVRIR
jgi:mono/diheme cytochrome c family protein